MQVKIVWGVFYKMLYLQLGAIDYARYGDTNIFTSYNGINGLMKDCSSNFIAHALYLPQSCDDLSKYPNKSYHRRIAPQFRSKFDCSSGD